MSFSWNKRYVLRRIDEGTSHFHRVFRHSLEAGDITDVDNYFSTEPAYVPMSDFAAQRIDPPAPWDVTLADRGTFPMGVFQLHSIK